MKKLSLRCISVIMALLFAFAPLSSAFAIKIPWLISYPSEKEIAETLGNLIKARDVDGISDMFSEEVKVEINDLNVQVKKLLDEIECDIEEYSWRGHGGSDESNYGYYHKSTSFRIIIPVSGKIYSVWATYVQAYTDDESKVGLRHLALDMRMADGKLLDYFTNISLPDKTIVNYKNTYQYVMTNSYWQQTHKELGYNRVNINSSDESVAKVDSDGMITAMGRGTARITVTYINEATGKELKYLCDVTVTFTNWQKIIWFLFFGFLWY